MLFHVKYTVGNVSGILTMNAADEAHALDRVRNRKREELPEQAKKRESYRVIGKHETLDV
jgi:hypothetical protein